MWVGGVSDLFSEKRFSGRVRLISILFAIGYAGITLRLFYLQILKGEDLAQLSESNRTQVVFLRAPRGDFYDRKGEVFVTNRPSWSLMFSAPEEGEDSGDVQSVKERLDPYLKDFPPRWLKRLKRSFKSGQMVRLAEDVPDKTSFAMREMGELLPGLSVVMEFRRGYPHGYSAGHLVGYLGEIDEKELRDDYWRPRKMGDLIGKMGLEKLMDENLRGRDGGMLIEVDSVGRLKRVIRELPSQKGSSIQLTLDLEVQKKAEELLMQTSTQRGAVVVMDVNTGSILAMASSPQIDPAGDMAEFLTDPRNPFFDRTYKGVYPPGSTFKIMTAIAGFRNNKIRINEEIFCKGYEALQDRRKRERRYKCWKKHGKVDFWTAVSQSCDAYFYLLGAKLGSELIHETAAEFGYGQPTQKFLPGEVGGSLPDPTWKKRRGLGGWSTGDTFNYSIGQGFLTSTPLQVTVMMAGVATKGKIFHPHIIDRIYREGSGGWVKNEPKIWKRVTLDEPIWAAIHEALRMTVRKGTGYGAYVPYLDVRGKTGTAQNPHGKDHAWFAAFAGYPGEPPSLAITAFVENGGNGGSIAAPIVNEVLRIALPEKIMEPSV